MFMMNLANSIYTNLRNGVVGYKLNHNNNNNNNNNKHINTECNNTLNYDMTNYMIETNNKANKLYNKLNSQSLLISKILHRYTDIEYDHNNETIICHKERPNNFIRKNGFELVVVFIFGVLAHFHFQRSHR
jgi:hypothetical protein